MPEVLFYRFLPCPWVRRVALLLTACVSVALAGNHRHHTQQPPTTTTTGKPKTDHELIQDLLSKYNQFKSEYNFMKSSLEDLSRQVMLQQFFVEERIRSDGGSGLKQVRNHADGTKTYLTDATASPGVAGLHEHANNVRTVGMGELNMVLNGVEFRTRHNDYRLRKPAQHSKNYDEMENIVYPKVPPEVLNKKTVHEQIMEMREWFKAWKTQDHSHRDYRKYFKPVLSYLEGGWTTNTKTLEEPFFSDRHHIDASSWFDLQDKVRYTSYAGSKSNLENFAYLPTTIINMKNGTAEYAQWNYRIAVHPLKDDLPFGSFSLVDDLTERMKRKNTMARHNDTRAARFTLKDKILTEREADHYHERPYHWGILDDLMYQIPGKDNYPGVIYDSSFGLPAYQIKPSYPLTPLNTARYHRWYKVEEKDAMGQKNVHRGFSDPNLFVAQTTNPKIAPMTVNYCRHGGRHSHHVENCTTYTERFTYAVPLEIIWLTPLLTWNPYNLAFTESTSDAQAKAVTASPSGTNYRNGELTPDRAYNGTHGRLFYHTPSDFFSSSKAVGFDKADTAKGTVGVLDPQGNVRKVVATGIRIILPEIEGVGKCRIRYPIIPFHADGEQTRKELDALKDMVMKMPTYSGMFEEVPTTVAQANALRAEVEHELEMAPTTRDPPGLHSHHVTIHQYDIDDLKAGHVVKGIFTSVDNQHQHSLDIKMVNGSYVMDKCDGLNQCWDGHPFHLTFLH